MHQGELLPKCLLEAYSLRPSSFVWLQARICIDLMHLLIFNKTIVDY